MKSRCRRAIRLNPSGWSIRAGLTVAAMVGSCGMAQGPKVIEGKSLKFPEYWEAPHETQLKSLLEGARVQPQAGGLYLISEAKLQTFRADGVAEMVVTAPEC